MQYKPNYYFSHTNACVVTTLSGALEICIIRIYVNDGLIITKSKYNKT